FRGAPIDGSVAALRTLRDRGIPYRVVTNYSATHRDSLARQFAAATGLPAEPERIITAASAAAGATRPPYAGRRLPALANPDAAPRRPGGGPPAATTRVDGCSCSPTRTPSASGTGSTS